jgi:hypothetical protein
MSWEQIKYIQYKIARAAEEARIPDRVSVKLSAISASLGMAPRIASRAGELAVRAMISSCVGERR